MKTTNSVKVQHDYASASETIAERVQLITCQVSEWMAWMSLKFIKQRKKRTSKNGEGPTLIECDTYRKYGHFEGDEQKLNHQMIVMRTKRNRRL